ncbi:hypothetical protein R3P38DRAFT_2814976 [Favolaschia claudopus]|uniref:Uncharacterized protein n=1 Tax=Favolaschia claudopus TaxID=2862362 RepID=A0AAV9Z2A4_9AGAR
MANTTSPATTALTSGPPTMTPEQEMASLVSQLAALSMASLDLTSQTIDGDNKTLSKLALTVARTCVDINGDLNLPLVLLRAHFILDRLPRVMNNVVQAAVAAAIRESDPLFVITEAPNPDVVETNLLAGNENAPYHVVCVGREPGLYLDSSVADNQVRGVPEQDRRKIIGRSAALNHYRTMYEQQKVKRVNEV